MYSGSPLGLIHLSNLNCLYVVTPNWSARVDFCICPRSSFPHRFFVVNNRLIVILKNVVLCVLELLVL